MKPSLSFVFAFFLCAACLVLSNKGNTASDTAPTSCGKDVSEAVAKANAALAMQDGNELRPALSCLVLAVDQLNAKLDDLIAGRIPFNGAITADQFFYNNAPEPNDTK